MNKWITVALALISSFRLEAQHKWAGNWEIPMVFQKNFPEKKKPDYWCRFYIREQKDTVNRYTWKSDVHHAKPIWSFTGWAAVRGDTMYMYALDYVDHRPKKERLVNRQNDPGQPFYILYSTGTRYMLRRLQGETEEPVEIKKMN